MHELINAMIASGSADDASGSADDATRALELLRTAARSSVVGEMRSEWLGVAMMLWMQAPLEVTGASTALHKRERQRERGTIVRGREKEAVRERQ
jgi:hypothetical protein